MRRFLQLAGTLALALLFGAWALRSGIPAWTESGFVLPDGSARVVLLRRPTGARPREQERRIRVEVPGRTPFTFDLAPETGGHHGIDLYRQTAVLADGAEVPVLRFRDHSGIYRVDLLRLRLLDPAEAARLSNGTFLGRIDTRSRRPRFIPASPAT